MDSKNSLLTTPVAILLGCFIIAVAILLHGGIIKINQLTTTKPEVVQQAQPAAPAAPTKVEVGVGHLPTKGSDKAKITIVEFADFRCPFCEKLFTQIDPSLTKDYLDTGKARFAFRHYAFLGPASTVASNAGECANEQGKFWQMHDWLYQNQPDESDTSLYTTDKLTAAAGTLGLNTDQFKTCLSTNKYNKNVTDDFNEGQKAGVNGTPATFINGKQISGACPYNVFDGAIKAELEGKSWSVVQCNLSVQ